MKAEHTRTPDISNDRFTQNELAELEKLSRFTIKDYFLTLWKGLLSLIVGGGIGCIILLLNIELPFLNLPALYFYQYDEWIMWAVLIVLCVIALRWLRHLINRIDAHILQITPIEYIALGLLGLSFILSAAGPYVAYPVPNIRPLSELLGTSTMQLYYVQIALLFIITAAIIRVLRAVIRPYRLPIRGTRRLNHLIIFTRDVILPVALFLTLLVLMVILLSTAFASIALGNERFEGSAILVCLFIFLALTSNLGNLLYFSLRTNQIFYQEAVRMPVYLLPLYLFWVSLLIIAIVCLRLFQEDMPSTQLGFVVSVLLVAMAFIMLVWHTRALELRARVLGGIGLCLGVITVLLLDLEMSVIPALIAFLGLGVISTTIILYIIGTVFETMKQKAFAQFDEPVGWQHLQAMQTNAHTAAFYNFYKTQMALKNTIAEFPKEIIHTGSYTCCLDGSWGSGKTSLLKLTKQDLQRTLPPLLRHSATRRKHFMARVKYYFIRLKQFLGLSQPNDILWIDFNPWHFSNSGELIENFFQALDAEVSRIYGNGLGKSMKQYVKIVSPAVTSAQSPILTSLKNVTDQLPFMQDKPLETHKAEIRRRLGTIRETIVISLDDIDRMEVADIMTVLKLVKLLSDFPHIIFVLSMDYDRVRASIVSEYGPHYETYLQKIINRRFKLEAYSYDELYAIFTYCIDSSSPLTASVTSEKIHRKQIFYDLCLQRFASQLRRQRIGAHETPLSDDRWTVEAELAFFEPLFANLNLTPKIRYPTHNLSSTYYEFRDIVRPLLNELMQDIVASSKYPSAERLTDEIIHFYRFLITLSDLQKVLFVMAKEQHETVMKTLRNHGIEPEVISADAHYELEADALRILRFNKASGQEGALWTLFKNSGYGEKMLFDEIEHCYNELFNNIKQLLRVHTDNTTASNIAKLITQKNIDDTERHVHQILHRPSHLDEGTARTVIIDTLFRGILTPRDIKEFLNELRHIDDISSHENVARLIRAFVSQHGE